MSSRLREKLELREYGNELRRFFERHPDEQATEFDKVVLEATLQSFTSPGKFSSLGNRLSSIGYSVAAYSKYDIKDVTMIYRKMLNGGRDFSNLTREAVMHSLGG
jgi:hypothetical protein